MELGADVSPDLLRTHCSAFYGFGEKPFEGIQDIDITRVYRAVVQLAVLGTLEISASDKIN